MKPSHDTQGSDEVTIKTGRTYADMSDMRSK